MRHPCFRREVLSLFALSTFVACASYDPSNSSQTRDISATHIGTGGSSPDTTGPDTVPSADAATPIDAYVAPIDAYVAPIDAHVAPIDAYVAPIDAHVAPIDAHVAPIDAHVAPIDAHVAPIDAHVSPTEASAPVVVRPGGQAQRPAYNTGTGFFVAGGKLYDPNGGEFRIRGVNRSHYDMAAPGIPKTHANAERVVLFFNNEWNCTPASNAKFMQDQIVANQIVPMPGNWEGTCNNDAATLTTIVDRWVEQYSSYASLQKSMILNIANEWGPSDSTVWRDSYITAIGRLRSAGYTCTISVTSGGCGQDNADLVKYAQAVFDSDPQKNVIFDQHIYGNWAYDAAKMTWQQGLNAGLDALAATKLVMIVGEFGPGNKIGPSPTDLKPADIMQAVEARGFGWLAWVWDDNSSDGDNGFALSHNGDYASSADLTAFGKVVVESPAIGLLAAAKPATGW
jgi:mannan endo-1,4-beta-mannosidase